MWLKIAMLKVVHDREIDCILGVEKICACCEYHVQEFHSMLKGQNFTYVMDGFKIFVQSSISSKSHLCKLNSHLETKMVKYLLLIIILLKTNLII
jgi:hypothetical protein